MLLEWYTAIKCFCDRTTKNTRTIALRIVVTEKNAAILISEKDLESNFETQFSELLASESQCHLLHLYNPRLVVEASIMPRYSWLFTKKDTTNIKEEDVTLAREITKMKGSNVLVAKEDALHLVAYLKSLQQFSFENIAATDFIPALPKEVNDNTLVNSKKTIGANLYQKNCAACHQGTGRGVKGAFPPLTGSLIVNDKNPETLVKIILMGYDARTEYGVMPAFADKLSAEDIKAIADNERSSWGNSAPKVPIETITKLRDSILKLK